MKTKSISFLLAFVAVVVLCIQVDAKFQLNWLRKDNPKCFRVVQQPTATANLKCTQSQAVCRSCCHFDVMRLNDAGHRPNKVFIKEAILLDRTGECVCELCEKTVEDFDNPAWF